MRTTVGAMLMAMAMAAPAHGGSPVTSCAVSAYFVDQDPTTNVRAAPASTAKVIAKVDPANAVATIREARSGWFRVDSIIDYENDKPLFRGRGWVHGSVLGLSVGSGEPKLYAEPSTHAMMLQRLTPDGNMLELIDCRGDWVKVRVDNTKMGWMASSSQCSNPFTTCS